MDDKEVIVFNGKKYTRRPHSSRKESRNYFSRSGSGGTDTLHRAIWEYHNGPIPKGMHIHHIDHNPLNNAIENLECLSRSEHVKKHWTEERQKAQEEHLDKVRHKAYAWHSTPEGIESHRGKGKLMWEHIRANKIVRNCAFCGDEFTCKTNRKRERFCSSKCSFNHRRASGVDDITVECGYCGKPFTKNKYKKTKSCSRSCGAKLRGKITR